MLLAFAQACVLVVATVTVHAAGFSALLRSMMRLRVLDRSGFVSAVLLVIGLTGWLLLVHLAEIALWGLFYLLNGCLPDAESALYFSGITYTTVGYGEIVLLKPWRMLAPLEAMTGILTCGLSTGLFFGVVSQWIGNWTKSRTVC